MSTVQLNLCAAHVFDYYLKYPFVLSNSAAESLFRQFSNGG